jgi:hypothetical protein
MSVCQTQHVVACFRQRKTSNFTAIEFARRTQSGFTSRAKKLSYFAQDRFERSYRGKTSPDGTANLLQRKHIHAEKWAKSRPFAIIPLLEMRRSQYSIKQLDNFPGAESILPASIVML